MYIYNSKGGIMRFLSILFAALISFQAFATVDIVTNSRTICVTPTITAGAYSVDDAVGGQLDFTDLVGIQRKTGLIQSLMLSDTSSQQSPLKIICFDQDFTEAADNAAISFSAFDISHATFIVSVDATDYHNLGFGSIAELDNIGKTIDLSDSTLRCQIQTTSDPSYDTDDALKVCIDVIKDSP